MNLVKKMAYFAVATFIVLTLPDLFPLGFALQDTLGSVIAWSCGLGLGVACVYRLVEASLSRLFRLESMGRLLELVVGCALYVGAFTWARYGYPDTFYLDGRITTIAVALSIMVVVEFLGLVTGELTLGGGLMPKRK